MSYTGTQEADAFTATVTLKRHGRVTVYDGAQRYEAMRYEVVIEHAGKSHARVVDIDGLTVPTKHLERLLDAYVGDVLREAGFVGRSLRVAT